MNVFSIAYNNLKHNIRTYALYLMAMVFSVAVYYNFIALKYNPEVLKASSASKYSEAAGNSTAFLLLLFLIFFTWYSNSFFLSQRKKEIGIYTFMGVNNWRIASIFTLESFLMGIMSIVIGLLIGVLFGKLFMMILAKFALLNVKIDFFISVGSIIETAITFLILFSLISIKGYFDIARSKLIDLLNALKKEEEIPKVNYFKSIGAIVLIGAGYYVASIALETNFSIAALITAILVVWGTYWLFGSLFSAVVRYLINKKRILYNGVNIVSISNMAFRIKKNYRTYATIAVLICATVTAFGTVSSIRYFINDTYKIDLPYTLTYLYDNEDTLDKVNEIISHSAHEILLDERVPFIELNVEEGKSFQNINDRTIIAIPFSNFEKITRDLKVSGADRIIEKMKPQKGEASFVQKPGVILSIVDNDKIKVGSMEFKIKEQIKTPLFGKGLRRFCLILRDEDYLNFKSRFKESKFNGITFSNEENSGKVSKEIFDILPSKDGFNCYFVAHKTSYDYMGMIYFLGAFLSLVFVVATGSIIYFKVLSEAVGDKGKYEILAKIGMTKEEIRHSVSKQVGIAFILPLVVGVIHSTVAISVLSEIMDYNLVIPMLMSILVFTVIYGMFYFLTTRKFLRIVSSLRD